jgi:hypothetical protein
MNRFWNRYIGPLVETVQPRRILEIGAQYGQNTRHILEYCRRTGCRADIVDPIAVPQLARLLKQFPDEHLYHQKRSIFAIPAVDAPDIALVDGDHNWQTVYKELNLLFVRAAETGAPPPIIIAHDCAWPYARRDMYYQPEQFEPAERQPFAYLGMVPGQSELTEQGMNTQLANALQEGGPENGVLTAIEDFIASTTTPIQLYVLPFFNGLGIAVPAARMTPALQALIDDFYSGPTMLEACKAIEMDTMRAQAELHANRNQLARRTEALTRARVLLAERAARIEELEAKLSAASKTPSR